LSQRKLEELSQRDCLVLLGAARVGRLVYVDEQGPVAIPVNFALADDDVVLRVEQGTKRLALEQPLVAFEVDHVDEVRQSAWSVIVRGKASEIEAERVPELLREMGGRPPTPWALGVHNTWIRITASQMTGRRLGATGSSAIF